MHFGSVPTAVGNHDGTDVGLYRRSVSREIKLPEHRFVTDRVSLVNAVRCPAIDGLISEADEVAAEVADKDVLDAAIIGSAQAVEHYEMARYGTLIAWAESAGHDDVVRLLNTNLNEEKAADRKLSTVALRKGVNRKAAS